MQNISRRVSQILLQEYGFEVYDMHKMTTGVGGDTYFINARQGRFIYKIADVNEMNHPKEEPEICSFLFQRGMEVSDFLRNKAGENFFRYMTPENAGNSYRHSYELAKERGETDILDELEFRLKTVQKICDWKFDLKKLTCCNSHGDYTVNQIICGKDKINAVIDWTCACRHPVIWEITRSFFYAEPSCMDGQYNEAKFGEYVGYYCSVAPLTQYDRDNLIKLYLYQLAVCDYYSQYLNADVHKKDEYLLQARFATKVLQNI